MGRNWKPYHQDGNIWVFTGNSNTESVVRHDLQHSIVARYLRFIPLGWSEEGQIGLRIEIYGCPYWADVIHFDGQGVISYRFKMKKMKILKDVIALKFKTGESDGVILHGEGQQGDYITLELRKGRLLLQINLGSNQYSSILGHTSVSSGSLLDDHHWHSVVIERYRRNVNFSLDQHTRHFRTNGDFDHLDLDYEATPDQGLRGTAVSSASTGCLSPQDESLEVVGAVVRLRDLVPAPITVRARSAGVWRPLRPAMRSQLRGELPFPGDCTRLAVPSPVRVTRCSVFFLRGGRIFEGSVSEKLMSLPPHSHLVASRFTRRRLSMTSRLAYETLRRNAMGTPLRDHALNHMLSFGGMPYSGKPISGGQRNFIGCMESINYNGENITDLARRKKLDTSSFRNLTFSCMDSNTFPVFFNATSFLQLPGRREHNMVSVSFQFRTWNANGLLLFSELAAGMLELVLKDGKVLVHISVLQPKSSHVDMASGSGLNDGEWHDVRFLAKENLAMLTIDGDESLAVRTNAAIHITTGGMYHFGGYYLRSLVSPSQRSFQGCMQLIQVDDQLADISAVEQGRIGVFENVSLDMCAIIDRCLPNHCEHGGRCTQTWDTFSCSCDGIGYAGATCHSSIYEQSCEAYKHLGKTSDFYWIDPDGSGPLGPFRVICNMTEDKVWTMVVNSLPAQTSVSGSSRERRTVLHLNYSATTEQISAITDAAEHCEQHIAYTCRSSRLLNTPDGTPYTWWVGRGNEKNFYWGGSAPGIKKCACGIERNCTDPKYYCNCDADQKQWREDSGLLVYKDHLPVSQVTVGDTNRAGSEAKLTVGALQCHGDRSYWNAASFTTPSSYLHFSTFQAETSADISFYFKTSAPRGVFLENLGNTDFIRLELKSPNVVSFSFDVGNGPVELKVHSPTPLNDDQWHRISAERNVKEAVLQLDQQYREVRAAPAQGHTRLELYSQLYVGAAGGQRGFLGCIRSLKMNGITLDLEDRAKVTPGVKPGCSGHCTSFGMYCRNGGKCVEKYNGYACDCSGTAYEGPFCTKGNASCVGTLWERLRISTSEDGEFSDAGEPMDFSQPALFEELLEVVTRAMYKLEIAWPDVKRKQRIPNVGAFFEAGTLVRYNLVPELMTATSNNEQKDLSPSQLADKNLTQEVVTFSFSTSSTPSILLYISSRSRDNMAVVLRHNGTLQLRYNLGGLHEPFTINLDQRNLANGQPHNVNLTRTEREIHVQLDHYPPVSYTLPDAANTHFTLVKNLFLGKVYETGPIDPVLTEKYNAPGFVGCMSRVQFNNIAPLKAALRSHPSLPVSHQGKLVESNCGSSPLTISPMSTTTDPWHLDGGANFPFNEEIIPDGVNRNSAVIGGIIAVVIFTILCILVFLIRHMFRHKGTYHTNESKEAKRSESADTAIIASEANFTETIDENKKEWFI
ncbi:contactin-associated protein-like 2 precursor [Silurus meridionalis]|nr:contactin-associated protein-like 2 precursor [Silurus meridionalis]